ncbi:MAG: HAMP domain-containing histidine kinase [Myxococcales bacterium]|nr:HAMP domain-containing histidine kinase [Myxococcales bacterium]
MAPAPRRRAALWVEIGVNLALLTVAVSALDAGVFWLATRYVLQEAAVDLAESAAMVVAAEVDAAPPAQWELIVEKNRESGLHGLAIWSVRDGAVVGAGGEIDDLVKRTVATHAVYSEVDGDSVRVVAPVGKGRPSAVVSLRYPLARVERPAWGVVIGHTLFASLVIGVFGWVLFRRNVVDPIRRISDATIRIAAGEFKTPVPDDAPKELAELAGALSAMGQSLASYQARTVEQLGSLADANVELRRAQDLLVRSEKLAVVGRLIAGLAHELGNPLAAVRGYMEFLVATPAADNGEILRRAQVEVERMHHLLRSLLDYARADESEPGAVALDELMAEALRTVQHQVAFRGVTVRVSAGPALSVVGEAAKLHQVLVNLLLNAAAAGARNVLLSVERVGTAIHLAVEDDGEGISAEHLPRLFEPFFSTRPPGQGTGLGLATALRMVEQHGGRIEVRSVVGTGSRFVCILSG